MKRTVFAFVLAFSVGVSLIAQEPSTLSSDKTSLPLPSVQLLVPGFSVRELPIKLTNLINVEYSPDGQLFAAGYDGRMHLLTDTDGDGLEDQVTTFWDKTGANYPLGMVFHDNAVYVLLSAEIVRFIDTNADKVPDKREIVLKDWDDPKLANHPLILQRRVDYGMGLAIGPDGSIYIGMGNGAYNNGYMLDSEGKLGDDKDKSYYDRNNPRGCVLKFSPDGKTKEQILTGVRYLMSMQFNRNGDLFATDQEGATWLPNGNPFDELLHLQSGRHYGFPPKHPTYLPDVIDEPSVFDYAPQHQSLCGFRFNNGGDGKTVFGPPSWQDDALITGFSRGKLYRTQLAKTDHGYVAQNHLIGSIQSLPTDLTFAPSGEMVVASHSGMPDWGTGPQGEGLLFKIRYQDSNVPQPVATWSAGPGEFRVAFNCPLEPLQLKSLAKNVHIETGRNVYTGDRFETIRPGYEVVKQQSASERTRVPVLTASLMADGRTLVVNTPESNAAQHFAITLPSLGRTPTQDGIEQQLSIDLLANRNGVETKWKASTGEEIWSGWIPHFDRTVTKRFTQSSSEHERLDLLLKQPGTLTLRAQLDLWQMLQPAIQPISKLDYERPVETVSVVVRASKPFQIQSRTATHISVEANATHLVTLNATGEENHWLPLELTVPTGEPELKLQISWFTDEDKRERAFPLQRFLLPWATPLAATTPVDRAKLPELVGGNWEAGRELFLGDATNCSKCHQSRGEGAKVGPDLSNLIHRDYVSVLRDIREPSAAINPDYLSYAVLLTSGQVLNGVIQKEFESSITIADSTGKSTDISREDIEEIRPSKVSVMPQDIVKLLSVEQLRDLLTYLLVEQKKLEKR
jgi:putative heme-binding domain-containing protein